MSTIALDLLHDEHHTHAPAPRMPVDPQLGAVLARHDDRLLADVGLTREDVLGPEEAWRTEWARQRSIWTL